MRVTRIERDRLIRAGAAEFVVLRVANTGRVREAVCDLCGGDETLAQTCLKCDRRGSLRFPVVVREKSENIVLVTLGSSASKEGVMVYRDSRATMTPRVHTIEKADIERAYVSGKEHDRERIEEWGKLAQLILAELLVPFRPDPWEGRALFNPLGRDQRTR